MSFIAGYLLGLSEQTASGGNEGETTEVFEAVDMLPALYTLPVYDGWEIRVKLSGDAEENRYYVYGHDSSGAFLPVSRIKSMKLYYCVYWNNRLMYGYSSFSPFNEYEYAYSEPDNYRLKRKTDYIITNFSARLRVISDDRYVTVENQYEYIFRQTDYNDDGTCTVNETQRSGLSSSNAFSSSNIGIAGGYDIAELTLWFQNACYRRYLQDNAN